MSLENITDVPLDGAVVALRKKRAEQWRLRELFRQEWRNSHRDAALETNISLATEDTSTTGTGTADKIVSILAS